VTFALVCGDNSQDSDNQIVRAITFVQELSLGQPIFSFLFYFQQIDLNAALMKYYSNIQLTFPYTCSNTTSYGSLPHAQISTMHSTFVNA